LVGDGTQRIFTRGFSLRGLGVEIAGRSLVLRKNYRNTRQILEAAFPLVADAWNRDMSEGEINPELASPVFSVREGPRPAIVRCRGITDEERFVRKEVRYLLGTGRYSPREICVMARNDTIRQRALAALEEAGIPALHYRAEDADGLMEPDKVRVSSLHSAKGHEYAAVFIPGLVDGVLPQRSATTDDELAAERAVLYVGITRARDIVYLSHSETGEHGQALAQSRFLASLSPKCDELVYP
jgi:superfamily I DNA/RNA helicase